MRVTSIGNVGIGTFAPKQIVHVRASTNGVGIGLRLDNADATSLTLHSIEEDFHLDRTTGGSAIDSFKAGRILESKEQDWTSTAGTIDS